MRYETCSGDDRISEDVGQCGEGHGCRWHTCRSLENMAAAADDDDADAAGESCSYRKCSPGNWRGGGCGWSPRGAGAGGFVWSTAVCEPEVYNYGRNIVDLVCVMALGIVCNWYIN